MNWTIRDQGLSTVDVIDSRGLLVAEVSNCSTEDLADQSLIVAAPAMLAALRQIDRLSRDMDPTDPLTAWALGDIARAVIAQATPMRTFDDWSVEEEQLHERRAHACDR